MRISDWSSDVCSSDRGIELLPVLLQLRRRSAGLMSAGSIDGFEVPLYRALTEPILLGGAPRGIAILNGTLAAAMGLGRSEEHTSELQSLMRISYAVFCFKKKKSKVETQNHRLKYIYYDAISMLFSL